MTRRFEAIDRDRRSRGGRVHPIDLILDEERPILDVNGVLVEVRRPVVPDTVDCCDVTGEAVLVRSLAALAADPFGHGVDPVVVRRIQALSEVTR
jgi:hypothetical protein